MQIGVALLGLRGPREGGEVKIDFPVEGVGGLHLKERLLGVRHPAAAQARAHQAQPHAPLRIRREAVEPAGIRKRGLEPGISAVGGVEVEQGAGTEEVEGVAVRCLRFCACLPPRGGRQHPQELDPALLVKPFRLLGRNRANRGCGGVLRRRFSGGFHVQEGQEGIAGDKAGNGRGRSIRAAEGEGEASVPHLH